MSGDRSKFVQDTDDTKDRIAEELVQWLNENGADLSKLSVRQYATEVRGVHADRDLSHGEIALSIPRRCCITVQMGKETSLGKAIIKEDLNFVAPKHVFLVVFLLSDMEKGDASFFSPYYKSLPSQLLNMPIFWTSEELAWLTGSSILQQIEDRKESIRRDYERICEVDPSFSRFSLTLFSWARMIVCSRNFGLSIDQQQTAALVPFADMLNHFRPRETSWTFDQDSQCFTISCLRDIRSGSQVFDSYGKKCNHRFLLNYGFAVEQNVEENGQNPNEVLVSLHIDDDTTEALQQEKLRFLARTGHEYAEVRMSKSHTDHSTREGFAIARVLVATSRELDMMVDSRNPCHVTPPLSADNEIRTLLLLSDLMKKKLAQYPTTLEQDNEMLASQSIQRFSNRYHAIVFTRGEKEVCHYYIRLADAMVPILRLPWDVCYSYMKSGFRESEDDILLYAQDVVMYLMSLERQMTIQSNMASTPNTLD